MGKKNIIIAAILATLSVGFNVANAQNSNSLTQMDIKKSSAADAVDVTFYTTGDSSNSVVSRKANNRYVVLLPNVSSNPSVTPGIGGVKDLITDINVKHVDDGIGGYTKITFTTTKPINIKTYTKKTGPLTQAQKDSKAIIAQNIKPIVSQTAKPQAQALKPVVNNVKPAVQSKPVQQAKPVTQPKETTQKASAPTKSVVQKFVPVEVSKAKTITPKTVAEKPKAQSQPKVQSQPKLTQQPKAQTSVNDFVHSNYEPKMKFDENGNRMMDLEPRVSHEIVPEGKKTTPVVDPLFNIEQTQAQALQSENAENLSSDIPKNEQTSNHFPIWILLAGGSILTLGVLYLIFDAKTNSSKKEQTRLQSFFNMSNKNQAKRRRREYYDIVNNDELNWQEKYKLYTEKEEERRPKTKVSDMKFVTDLSGSQKAVIMPSNQAEKSPREIAQEKLQAQISHLEHSLAQTPSLKEPEEIQTGVRSEDNAILNKMSDIKLKSFSKPLTLKETHRSLLEDDKKISRNKSYKEGRFVKLKNSPLSVNQRKSASSDLNASDLIGTGNKYLTNSGEIKMNKENENYLLSSLDEYLSILDSEETARSNVSVADSLAQVKSPASDVMNRSGVTNPISRSSNPMSTPYMNGLVVKSGFNIDSEKGFYLVNIDGVSALVGRIKDQVFILKKFDRVIDKPLQVRLDDDNVYIVRAGKFKCLVDVSKEKMGTLIEI
ncbi:hypothetical protein IJ541_05385 [bacterium]|nr:hypothetical protein [bacterium]